MYDVFVATRRQMLSHITRISERVWCRTNRVFGRTEVYNFFMHQGNLEYIPTIQELVSLL